MICWWGRKENGELCKNEAIEAYDPFCSLECHEGYAVSLAPAVKKNGKPRLTIEQMKARLLEMAKEARIKNENLRSS